MARAIFQSWFVDFDPVRVKAEGSDNGLPPEIAILFPDGFEEVNGKEVPRGWGVEPLGNVIELGYGKALKQENRLSGKIPVYGSNGQIGWHDEKLVGGPGIIVGRKGNPGIIHWSATDFFPIDTTFFVIPKGDVMSLYYLYHELQRQDLPSLGADSAVPGLNRNLVYMSKIIVPPQKILEKFDVLLKSLDQTIQNNDIQSRTLASIRDVLLPKLMSGEIRVDNITS
jgi:type I restriction enzyme S subunit